MKKVVIIQSNYIPWKGYFDLIAAADECIIYDDMQYTIRDWRNRNRIKTPHGVQWLSIPVSVKGKYTQSIRNTTLVDSAWQQKHWQTICHFYKKAKYFKEIATWLEPLYLRIHYTHLTEVNRCFIEGICTYLGIATTISNSWDYTLIEGKTERLVDLCSQAGATEYISGPAARDYIEEYIFLENNITLSWFNYSGYPEYTQLYGDFAHTVSILDLLFNCGKFSNSYMKMTSGYGPHTV